MKPAESEGREGVLELEKKKSEIVVLESKAKHELGKRKSDFYRGRLKD